MGFEKCLPKYVYAGSKGWEFTKYEEDYVRTVLPAMSNEEKTHKMFALKARKDYEKAHPAKNKTARYSDPEWKKLNYEVQKVSISRHCAGKETVHSKVIRWAGSNDREARSALRVALSGYKLLWNYCNKDEKEFEYLLEQLQKGEILPETETVGFSRAEQIGRCGHFKFKQPEYDCCDRYDFGPWTK